MAAVGTSRHNVWLGQSPIRLDRRVGGKKKAEKEELDAGVEGTDRMRQLREDLLSFRIYTPSWNGCGC